MGQTHFSGVQVGDVGSGIFGSAELVQKVKLTALNAPQQLHFTDRAIITKVMTTNASDALVAATLKIGTAPGGTQIFTGAVTAGEALDVLKPAPAGFAYVEASVGTVPLNVYVYYHNA